jgi:zinc protease
MRFRVVLSALMLLALASQRVTADSPTYAAIKSPGGITFLHRFDQSTAHAAVVFGWPDVYGPVHKDKAGLSALIGDQLLARADGSLAASVAERLSMLGATASLGSTGFQYRGKVQAPADNLAEALRLTARALTTAELTEREFRQVMQARIDDDAGASTRSETIAQRAALRLGLGDHPAVSSIATNRFDGLLPADIQGWRKETLSRSGLKVVVSGRVTAAAASAALDAAFGDLPERVAALEPVSWPSVVPFKPRTIVIERETPRTAVLLIGRTDYVAGPPAQLAMVANNILGGGPDGRIYQAVRVGLGASYGGGSGFLMIDPGQRLVRVTATVANDQVAPSLLAMRRTYAGWHNEGVTATELSAVVARTSKATVDMLQDLAGANSLALDMMISDRPISDLHGYAALLEALTVPDINDMIRSTFPKPDQLLSVIVTPSAARLIQAGVTVHCVVRSLDEIDRCKR